MVQEKLHRRTWNAELKTKTFSVSSFHIPHFALEKNYLSRLNRHIPRIRNPKRGQASTQHGKYLTTSARKTADLLQRAKLQGVCTARNRV
jgi:hypothetical protein